MERMDGTINAREAELKEVIKINNKEIAYLSNRAKNTETELDQVKRDNEKLEEENKKLDEAYQIARNRVIELLGDIELYLQHIKELEEENEELKEYKSMYEGLY